MLIQHLFENDVFNNWSVHNQETIESDFSEYKHKEDYKWEGRAESMGFRFPIFDSISHYKESLESGTIVIVDDALWESISNLSSNDTIEDIEDMVSGYTMPRDVQRILRGFKNNDPMPYPVILKGTNGLHMMSGNTRLNVARVLGIEPKAIIIDVRNYNENR